MNREILTNYVRYGTPKNFKYKYDEEQKLFKDEQGRIFVPVEDKAELINAYIADVKYTGNVRKLYNTLKEMYGNITMSDIQNARLLNENVQVLRQSKKKKYIKPIKVDGPGKVVQIDLIDMQKLSRWNDGARYVLTAIDIFSKLCNAIPLKDKTVKNVIEAMDKILRDGLGPVASRIQADNGSEFKNKFENYMKEVHEIEVFHSSAYMPTSQGVVERFNRELKDRLNFYMLQNNTKRWIDALPNIVWNHNESIHATTGMAPLDVYSLDDDEIEELYKRMYKQHEKDYIHGFRVGDVVRIHYKTKKEERKNKFKQNPQKWSKELYSIHTITESETKPPELRLFNWYSRRPMKKRYFEHQLLKAALPDGTTNVEEDGYDGRYHIIEL